MSTEENNSNKENISATFIKDTKNQLLQSFEKFVETNIETRMNLLVNRLVEDKVDKYETLICSIMEHPLIACEIDVYKNRINLLENEISKLTNSSNSNITLEIIDNKPVHVEPDKCPNNTSDVSEPKLIDFSAPRYDVEYTDDGETALLKRSGETIQINVKTEEEDRFVLCEECDLHVDCNKDNIHITYVDYIVNNMIMTWFIGFLTMITIVHIWARRKTGDCRLGDDW